jgi:hypothetical protein
MDKKVKLIINTTNGKEYRFVTDDCSLYETAWQYQIEKDNGVFVVYNCRGVRISFPLVSVVKFFVPQHGLFLQKEITEKEISPGIYEIEHYVPVIKKETTVTTEERHLE